MVTNQASALAAVLVMPSGDRKATRSGTPEATARPPVLAMNIRTEVRMVISLVSRVSDALSAP